MRTDASEFQGMINTSKYVLLTDGELFFLSSQIAKFRFVVCTHEQLLLGLLLTF